MIQNSDFLDVLSERAPTGTHLWTNAFTGDPGHTNAPWGGSKYIPGRSDVDSLVNRNTYYSVSALKAVNSAVSRKNENFARLLALVADDPDITRLNGEPSFIIETSPGKYQTGIFIVSDDPNASDIAVVNGLLSAMANVGLMPVDGSGNNAVRYCRLPVGLNQKPRAVGDFQHRLIAWNPEVEHTLLDAAEIFGVSFDSADHARASSSSSEPQDKKLNDLVKNIIAGEALHDSINRLAGSLIASGLHGGSVTNLLRSLMEVSGRRKLDPKTWQERYDYINEAVVSAEKFRQKQQQKQEFTEKESEHIYDLSALKPVEFVIDGFISNKITVIAGPPGVGKTSLLVPLAFHAAHLCKDDSELKPMLKRRIIYVTEDAEQVERIIYGICKHEQIPEPKEGFRYWFRIENAKRQKDEDLSDFILKMRQQYAVTLGPEQNEYAVEPLIVLDTSNATIDLDNENDNAEAGKVLSAIKEAMGRSAIWLVAHTSKVTSKTEADQMSARGAGAFEGDANAVAYLLNLDGQRFLTLGKRRFEADFTDIKFESYSNSENVLTPWGDTQIVRYRYGIPHKSNTEERISAKESNAEFEKAALRFNIRSEILRILAEHGDMSKSQVKKQVKGKSEIKDEVIFDLVEEGLVVVRKGSHNADILHILNPRPYRSSCSHGNN